MKDKKEKIHKTNALRQLDRLYNIQKYNINNGFVEGKNNKIKVINRLSYEIKKFDNLKKFIQLRIS